MTDEKLRTLDVDGTEYITEVPENTFRSFRGTPDLTRVRAFIPGVIVDLRISPGDRVARGSVLLLLDAMKMHNEVCSELVGRVRSVHVKVGDSVQKEQLMVEIDPD